MRVLNELWLNREEASQVLSEVNGRPIGVDYIRVLARRGKIQSQPIDQRTRVYSAQDCRNCKIQLYAHKKRQS